MNRLKKIAAAMAFGFAAALPWTAQAAENPTCVLMKFTDDTRFDRIESAQSLSDLLMEKMIASGRFNLKETRPIEQNMEAMIYDEKMAELSGIRAAVEEEDMTPLFEGPGFNESKAQSIATAALGQIVDPSITESIGEAHGAQYLIQGTIINLGVGNWWEDQNYFMISQAVNLASSLVAQPIMGALSSALGPLGAVLGGLGGGFDMKTTGIGVQSDIRVIRADTGEVVWLKRVTGRNTQKQYGIGMVKIGSTKLNANIYAKAMDVTAQKIVDEMIADMDAGKLFAK